MPIPRTSESLASAIAIALLMAVLAPAVASAQNPPPPPPRQEGTAEAAFVGTTGNSSTSTISLGGEHIYRPTAWVIKNRFLFVRNTTSGTATAESILYRFRAERAINTRMSAFGDFTAFRESGVRTSISGPSAARRDSGWAGWVPGPRVSRLCASFSRWYSSAVMSSKPGFPVARQEKPIRTDTNPMLTARMPIAFMMASH